MSTPSTRSSPRFAPASSGSTSPATPPPTWLPGWWRSSRNIPRSSASQPASASPVRWTQARTRYWPTTSVRPLGRRRGAVVPVIVERLHHLPDHRGRDRRVRAGRRAYELLRGIGGLGPGPGDPGRLAGRRLAYPRAWRRRGGAPGRPRFPGVSADRGQVRLSPGRDRQQRRRGDRHGSRRLALHHRSG